MSWADRLRIWGRLLVLQAVWSYRRMQTCGWLWVVEPVARRVAPDHPARLLSRVVIQFNTHSLLAPLLLGAATRTVADHPDNHQAATTHLVRWMGTFGALGDMIYWQAALWNFVWLAGGVYLLWGTTGLLWLAAVWTAGEIVFRIALFEIGYARPDGIARVMRHLASPRWRNAATAVAIPMMGLVAGVVFGEANAVAQHPWRYDVVGVAGAVVAMLIAVKTRFRSVVLWLPLALGLAIALLE